MRLTESAILNFVDCTLAISVRVPRIHVDLSTLTFDLVTMQVSVYELRAYNVTINSEYGVTIRSFVIVHVMPGL